MRGVQWQPAIGRRVLMEEHYQGASSVDNVNDGAAGDIVADRNPCGPQMKGPRCCRYRACVCVQASKQYHHTLVNSRNLRNPVIRGSAGLEFGRIVKLKLKQ